MMKSESVKSLVPSSDLVLSHIVKNQRETEYDELELELPANNNNNNKSAIFPPWLAGSMYTVSAGKYHFEDSGFTVEHMTDGFCIISKVKICPKDGRVILQKRFEQSDALKKAEKAGKPVLAEFFTPSSTDVTKSRLGRWMSMLQIENSDNGNHNIFEFGGHLFTSKGLAFFRQIDGQDLSTGQKFDSLKLFGLNGISPHPLIDHDGTFYCTGGAISPTGAKQHIFKIPPPFTGQGKVKDKDLQSLMKGYKTVVSHPMTRAMHINIHHSFMITENYLVLLEQPYYLNIKKVMGHVVSGAPVTFIGLMEWSPENMPGNKFVIMDKKSGKAVKTMEVWTNEPFFFLHFINCYEQVGEGGETQIVVDLNSHRNTDHFEQYRMSEFSKTPEERQSSCCPLEDAGVFHRFVVPLVSAETYNHNRNNKRRGSRRPSILEPSEIAPCEKSTNNANIENETTPNLPLFINRPLLSKEESLANFGATATISTAGKDENENSVPHIVLSPGSISQYGIHFGLINPNFRFKPYRYLYGTVGICLNSPYHNSMVKFDLKTGSQISWRPQTEGEVLIITNGSFVPNPEGDGEDDGILICPAASVSTQCKPQKDYILFINAKTMEEIGRATSNKGHTIPLNLHSIFVPAQ